MEKRRINRWVNIGLFSLSAFFFVLAILIYLFTKLPSLYGINYIYYIFFLLLMSIALAISTRFTLVVRVNILLLFLLPLITVYSYETYLAIGFDPLGNTHKQWKKYNIDGDMRTPTEVLKDLRLAGKSAFPALIPLDYLKRGKFKTMRSVLSGENGEILPLSGKSNVLTVMCNEDGRYRIYQADEYGFRNPSGLWGLSEYDFGIVGDSYGHGYCVDDNVTFASRIRAKFPATINISYNANSPLLELAGVKEYLSLKEPKIVLWLYYEGNDLRDLDKERMSPLLMSYLEDPDFSQNLFKIKPQIDKILKEYYKNLASVNTTGISRYFRRIVKLFYLRDEIRKYFAPVASKDISLLGRVLSRARSMVEGWRGRLVFVMIPDRRRSFGNISDTERNVDERVMDTALKLGLTVIRLQDMVEKIDDPLTIYPHENAHFNGKGYGMAADYVLEQLFKDGILAVGDR